MPKCVYCGKMYDVHKGLTLVKSDGNIHYLCSSKCKKNMEMKRRKVRWISKKKKAKKQTPVPVETKEEIVKDIKGDKVPEEIAEKEEKIAEKEEKKTEKKE
jgi:large subunit ribosomal protein L24e